LNLSELLNDYFDNNIISMSSSKTLLTENKSDLPVKKKESKWEVEDRFMSREFEFKREEEQDYFITELVKFRRESDADIRIIIKKDTVKTVVYSISPYISEIETEAVEDIDKIKKDVFYYVEDLKQTNE
jgi:hypothetical protein